MTDAIRFKPYAPRHVRETLYGEWKLWFAWWPVFTQQGETVWMQNVYYRESFNPAWFIREVPHLQYSLIKKGYWEQ